MPRPLFGYKVLDLSRILAGPLAAQLLADLGAEVIKVEPPSGDPSRNWGPPFEEGGDRESAYFRCANRGKKGIVLDFSNPVDLRRLITLLGEADAVLENFLPDSAEKHGLTWDRLHARFPKLIVASIRGFASDVPAARRAGYDFIAQAESGWMSLTGEPDDRPLKTGTALADLLCGLYAANGLQAALLHRERTGEALHVEVPLFEAALSGLLNVASGALMTGEAPTRRGNAHPNIVPHQTFACLGGEVALGVGSDRQFEVLALWLGLDLEAEPQWRTNPGRVRDRQRLEPLLETRLASLRAEEVLDFCATHAIPAGRVRSVEDALFHQAGTLHRLIQPLYDPATGGIIPLLASPLLLDSQRACAALPPPRWER